MENWMKRKRRCVSHCIVIFLSLLNATCYVVTTELSYDLYVTEEESPPVYIGKLPSIVNKRIKFSDDIFESFISVDTNTGLISATRKIDRDTLRNDVIHFTALSDVTYPIEVNIHVKDINDNHPSFKSNVQHLFIAESANTGSKLILTSAFDIDTGLNGFVNNYTIKGRDHGNDVFRVGYDVASRNVYLVLTNKLDRESKSNYVLELTAYDSGNPMRFGSCLLNITVTDVNDNRPLFADSHIELFAFENTAVGENLLTFNVTDLDEHMNSVVSYTLHGTNALYFSVENGSLKLLKNLDFELFAQVDLDVIVTDHGTPSLGSRATLKLRVLDVNDNAPKTKLLKGSKMSITEGSTSSILTLISVSDEDSEKVNGDVSLKLTNYNHLFDLTKFDMSSPHSLQFKDHFSDGQSIYFLLKVRGVLDREIQSEYNITLVASDNKHSTATHALLTVLDQNDNAPLFMDISPSIRLDASVPYGSFVALTRAVDIDEGSNGLVVYELQHAPPYSNFFEVNNKTGVIITNASLAQCVNESFILNVIARDRGSSPLSTSLNLSVTLENMKNVCVPKFIGDTYNNITITGETTIGGVFAEFKAVCTRGEIIISYYFQSDYKSYFELDSATGMLYLRRNFENNRNVRIKVFGVNLENPLFFSVIEVSIHVSNISTYKPLYDQQLKIIDLRNISNYTEPIGKFAVNKTYAGGRKFTYIITSGNQKEVYFLNSSTAELFVINHQQQCALLRVTAMENNSPKHYIDIFISSMFASATNVTFVRTSYTFYIAENSPAGSIVGRTTTTRASEYGRYFIESGDQHGLFSINSNGYISIATVILHHRIQVFNLTVTYLFGCAFTRTRVVVSVVDTNNHVPVFTSPNVITIADTTDVMTVIYNTAIEDFDVGTNKKVTFELHDDDGQQFCIESDTGEIHLLRPISKAFYIVEIVAQDHGSPSLQSAMTLSIIINETVNDTPMFMSRDVVIVLDVNQPLYTPFYELRAFDEDTGTNGQISFYADSELYNVYSNGLLYLKRKLTTNLAFHEFIVYVQDFRNPPHRANITVFIHIDRHAASALFHSSTYCINITEGTPLNTTIGRVPLNSWITSATLSLAKKNEYIDLIGGELTIKVEIDRENINQRFGNDLIVLHIHGETNNKYGAKDTCLVVIRVFDTNDHPPKFRKKRSHVNMDAVRRGLAVVAKDQDVFPHNIIHYKITNNDGRNQFVVNETTGRLYINETYSGVPGVETHKLNILAYDPTKEEFNDTTNIIVFKDEKNNHAPVFTNDANITVAIYENTTLGSVIYTLEASDADKYSLLTYDVEGHANDKFTVHPYTGHIQLSSPLDFELRKRYQLKMIVSDGYFSDYTYFFVDIKDVNDNIPIFATSSLAWTIRNDVTIGTIIGACAATDLDTDDVLTYSLRWDPIVAKYFTIDENTCEVSVSQDIVEIDETKVKLNITASDRLHMSFLTVTVTVNIVTAPVVVSTEAVVVDTHVKPSINESIYQVMVDRNFEGSTQYLIEDGTYANLFHLNSSTGCLYLFSPWPQNVWHTKLKLKVASTNGKATSFILLLFQATQRDILFKHSKYYASTTENSGRGVYLLELNAQNRKDSSKDSQITYHITDGAMHYHFNLNQSDGRVYIARNIDREVTGSNVLFTAYAVDLSNPLSQASSTSVHITIYDENDNYPTFDNQNTVSLPEDVHVSSKVLDLTVTDGDEGSNGVIFYSIVSGNSEGKFLINSSCGAVIIKKALDREMTSCYVMNVSASDKGVIPKISYVTLTVTVTDINDNVPTFNQSTYYFYIDESEYVGMVAGVVVAADNDDGKNGEIYYQITSGSYGYFTIDETSGVITTTKAIVYSNTKLFMLMIKAFDGSDEAFSSNATVFITISEIIDFSPRFRQRRYFIEISEDVTQNTVVLSLRDQVVDFTDLLNFEISGGNQENYFAISANGDLFAAGNLDRETKQSYTLYVTVSNSKGKRNCDASFAVVDVNLKDVNDNFPYFKVEPIIYILENKTPVSIVGNLNVFDDDSGANALLAYQMVNPNNTFSIGPNGQVNLLTSLDYEAMREYRIYINTCDHGLPRLCSNQSVRVFVTDVNDNIPYFLGHEEQITVTENSTMEFSILTLRAVDKDSSSNGQLEFQLVSYKHLFEVDEELGVFSLKHGLYIPNGKYDIHIRVIDHGIPQLSNTTHFVLNVDISYPPMFEKRAHDLTLKENHGPISYFTRVEAVVNNTKNTSNLLYSLNHSFPIDGYFTISSTTGVLSLLKPVDRETIPIFNLTVKVEDKSSPSLVDFATVHITVLDENDNAPVVDSKINAASIWENMPGGVHVFTVKAYDLDASENGRLNFSMINCESFLSINPNTGEVISIVSFDYEWRTSYQVSILVSDYGSPEQQTTFNMMLNVLDVNDNRPMFDHNIYRRNINVQPGLPRQSFIFQLTATDKDSSANSQMKFKMRNHSMFILDENAGIIRNRDIIPSKHISFTLELTALDPFIPQYQDNAQIVLTVSPLGQFPVVTPSVVFLEIREEDEKYLTYSLWQVNGSSPLDGLVGVVKYSIANANNEKFYLKGRQLYLREKLDYEKNTHHVVWVRVSDSQQPPLQSYAKIIIYVTNINDNPPRFHQKIYNITVPEDEPNNAIIYQVKAIDLDGPTNNMRYLLNDSVNFSINQTDGEITTQALFDYETKKYYVVMATVYDITNIKQTDTMLLFVSIGNVNDNPPMGEAQYNITVPETFAVNETFLRIAATDVDHLNQLRFYVNSSVFGVGEYSGDVHLVSSLDRERINFYNFNITVTDGAHDIVTRIQLNVSDVNDFPPSFENRTIRLFVPENVSINASVYTLKLYDEDIGDNAKSNIFLSTNNTNVTEQFHVTTNGEIILLKNLYLTGQSISFNFTVSAQNIKAPKYNSSATVIIAVVDVNDHAPVFNQSTYTTYISYLSRVGQFVTTVSAYDVFDLNENSRVSYDIVSGNDTTLFYIASSGNLYVNKSLQRYFKTWLHFVIEARDHGYPQMKSRCLIKVFIEEVNKYPPEIINNIYVKLLPEDTTPHAQVMRIDARDFETAKTALSYQITSGSDNNWYIYLNGTLSFRYSLDYETRQSYTLVIAVFDQNFLVQKSSQKTFYITVTDVNDNTPLFNQTSYTKHVLENFNINHVITQVFASDADSPVNNKVTYSIQPKNTRFVIHHQSGEISSTKKFDYEKQPEFFFAIIATDNGSPPLTSLVNITILVRSVNEFPPMFKSHLYNFTVSESADSRTIAGQVEAIDKDKGYDGKCDYIQTLPIDSGFVVNSTTGVIQISNKLAAGMVNFSIVVKNPAKFIDVNFIDVASVTVTILPEREHPMFERKLYQVYLYENTSVSTVILQIKATLKEFDSSRIKYRLENNTHPFNVNQFNGVVTTTAQLDRETTALYNLTLIASLQDHISILLGYSTLMVVVLDVNDNAPTLKNCFGSIVENSAIGTIIVSLEANDIDSYPNAKPFLYVFEKFSSVFALNKTTGILSNIVKLDFEEKNEYKFNLVVTDNGQPKLSTTMECIVIVKDVNDNPGKERHSKVIINYGRSKMDIVDKNETFVGNLSPIDLDVNDTYKCELGEGNQKNLYFQSNSCRLYASSDRIKSNVTDVRYIGRMSDVETISCTTEIRAVNVSADVYPVTIMIHVSEVSAYEFVNNSLVTLEKYFNLKLQSVGSTQTRIISVQVHNGGLYVVLSFNSVDEQDKSLFVQMMESNLNEIQRIVLSNKVEIGFDPCLANPCHENTRCHFELDFFGKEIINTDNVVFHSSICAVNKICTCLTGWVGERCNRRPSSCQPNPCMNNGTCHQVGDNTINCTCGKYFQGSFCQFDIDECTDCPCKNNGKCINKHGGFLCVCKKKFVGSLCETETTPCYSNPCMNNGKCVSLADTFKCECLFGDYGLRCEKQSLNFRGVSYMKPNTPITLNRFSYNVEFATVEKSALLLFLYSNGSSVEVELHDGRIKVSLSSGDQVSVFANDVYVSDGMFHSLELTLMHKEKLKGVGNDTGYLGKVLTVELMSVMKTKCSYLIGLFIRLSNNFMSNIGGIESKDIIYRFARFLSSTDFIGCMRNIIMNNVSITRSNSIANDGVQAGCRRSIECNSNPCGNGECIDLWSKVECRCSDGYIAERCRTKYKSVKLENSVIRLQLTESYKRKMLLAKSIRRRRVALVEENFLLLQFRTRKENGILFNSTCNRGFTHLYLNNGRVHYSSSLNNITGASSLLQSSVSDGKWHNVSMSVHGNVVSLILDYYQSTKHIYANNMHQFLSVDVNGLLFGNEFVGCLGKLKLNNDSMYLSSSTRLYKMTTTASTSLGCMSTDVCQSNPCAKKTRNHCVDDWEAFSCVSPGKCINKPCEHNGMCRPVGTTSFSCDCSRTKYTGQVCETPEVCVPNPCQIDEICSSKGDNFTCASITVNEVKTGILDEKIIIVITLCGIVVLAVLIGCFAARRRWQGKKVMKGTFEKGFDNTGQDLDILDEHSRHKDINRMQINRSNLSLPAYSVERDHPGNLSRYKSADIPLQRFRSTDEIANIQRGVCNENFTSNESLDAMFTSMKPQQVAIESGFESTGSDIVCFQSPKETLNVPEAYDLDDASLAYSEMSFRYDTGSLRNIPMMQVVSDNVSMTTDTVFGSEISEMTYSTDSDSDASFTCSECEYGKMSQNKRRHNPAYVLAQSERSRRLCRECEEFSDSSSYTTSMASFSTSEQATSLRQRSMQQNRRRKRKQNIHLRQKMLNSHMSRRNNIGRGSKEHLSGLENRSYELEEVPESMNEEYV